MKKNGIKVITWSLILAMGASYLPVKNDLFHITKMTRVHAAMTSKVETAEGFIIGANSMNTEAIVYGYKGKESEVTVPDMFEGLPITTISSYTFNGNERIKKIRFGENVRELQDYAVTKMENLEEVIIPGSVTSLGKNAIDWNGYDGKLKRLIFENGDKTLTLKATSFGGSATGGAKLDKLEYLELGRHVVFANENFLSGAGKLSEIVVDKDNPYYTVKHNILFDKEMTTLLRGFYEAEYLGIPATVTRIATGALDTCSGATWVSVEGPVPFGSNQFAVFGKTALFYYPEDMPEWNDVPHLQMAETMRIPITVDMKRVKDTVSNLSLPKLKAEDMADLEEVKALYQDMNGFQKTWVEDLCDLTLLEQAKEWVQGLSVKDMVSKLPDPADITLEHKETIEEAGVIFDELTEIGQEALGSAMNYKLRLLRKKIHDIQQVKSIVPDKKSLEGQVGDTFQVKVDVQPVYAINKNFIYKSLDDQIAASTTLTSESGFVVELKKPGETTILAQAIDSDCDEDDEPIVTAEMRVPVLVRLKAPEKLSIRQLYDASVEVTWAPVQSAVSYEVYRTEDGGKSTYIGSTITCDKVDSGLVPDVKYQYQVVAVYSDKKYNSQKSQSVSCSIKTGTADKVEGTGTSGLGVSLTWQAAAGAAKYEIYRNTFATGTFTLVGESQTTTYQDKTAADGGTYYYKIVAVSEKGGKGGESSVIKVSVPIGKPGSITVKKEGSKAVLLTWTQIDGALRYHIYRSTSANENYIKLHTIAGTSYTDNTISNNKAYFYKIQALSENGEIISEQSDSVSICVPSKVKSFKAVRKGTKKAKLTWKKVSGATGYEIYRSTKKSKGFKKIKTISKVKTVSYTDKKIKANKYYYYKIRCYWKKGDVTVYSGYSSTVRIKKKK